MKIKRFMQSGFRIENDNMIIYFDPFKIPDILTSEKADIIFISHPHFDHYDNKSIMKIKKTTTTVICPKTVNKIVKKWNAIGMNIGDSIEIDGIKIEAVPARNSKIPLHTEKKAWLGYIIEIGNEVIYHAGDTEFIPEMEKFSLKKIDFAFLPIGGFFTMNTKTAIIAAKIIKPKIIIPMHERLKKLDDFKIKLEEDVPDVKVKILYPGETFSK